MAQLNFTDRVEPLGQAGLARKLEATGASGTTNIALTAGVFRISMRAVGADICFSIGPGTQTATSSSHFIANGERLDFAVPPGANIAVLRNGTTNGTLEVTELN